MLTKELQKLDLRTKTIPNFPKVKKNLELLPIFVGFGTGKGSGRDEELNYFNILCTNFKCKICTPKRRFSLLLKKET